VLVDFYTSGSWLRTLHVVCATLSLALFVLRGTWRLLDSPQLQRRWIRIVPHVIDTVFLGAGIALAVRIEQYPFVHAWLTAKVLGLIGYILLGSLALKGPNRPVRAIAFVAALGLFAYIASVARYRHPLGFLLWA
jgi:uncharacterized membrane protein SirB2